MEAHTEVRSRRPRGLLVNQGPTWDGRSCTVGFPLIRALLGQPSDLLGYHYEGKVARVQVGGVYECVYTREGVRAVVTVPVVPGPTVLSPKAGASLARTANLTVTYVPGLSAGVSGEINQPQGAGGEF